MPKKNFPRRHKGPLGGTIPMLKVHRRSAKISSTTLEAFTPSILSATPQSVANELELPRTQEVTTVSCDDDIPAESSAYSQAKADELKRWAGVRPGMLNAAYDIACPSTQTCVVCGGLSAVIRCLDCGPMYFACCACAHTDHRYRQLHTVDIWQVCLYASNS